MPYLLFYVHHGRTSEKLLSGLFQIFVLHSCAFSLSEMEIDNLLYNAFFQLNIYRNIKILILIVDNLQCSATITHVLEKINDYFLLEERCT